MTAHLKGFLIFLALLALLTLSFRVALISESAVVMFVVGALAGAIFGAAAWKSASLFAAKLSNWSLALAVFLVAIVREIYPIEYDRNIGWAFVIGMLISMISLAAIVIFRPSVRHERTR